MLNVTRRDADRALLVYLGIGRSPTAESRQEFAELARAAGAEPVGDIGGQRNAPDSRFYVGSGKAAEICEAASVLRADVVLINHDLSPSQERNLESEIKCRVLDRAGLILDIFAQRARSFEGKLQVELAQLEHLSTRLIRGWTHLERQKGGIGLRGPGETQLETDRRLIGQRIKTLHRRIERVRQQREQGRRTRRRAEVPTVSLVGYTNAGKSTLFNRLTEATVHAADQLFATLDPTLRRLKPTGGQAVVVADTVGFISDLPHELVAAFRATLEETREAQLLLHVIDSASDVRREQVRDVNEVLEDIGADEIPRILVYNKIDLSGLEPRIARDEAGNIREAWVSAQTGAGCAELAEAISAMLKKELVRRTLRLSAHDARLRSRLFEAGAVQAERYSDDGGWELDLELPAAALAQILSRHAPGNGEH